MKRSWRNAIRLNSDTTHALECTKKRFCIAKSVQTYLDTLKFPEIEKPFNKKYTQTAGAGRVVLYPSEVLPQPFNDGAIVICAVGMTQAVKQL